MGCSMRGRENVPGRYGTEKRWGGDDEFMREEEDFRRSDVCEGKKNKRLGTVAVAHATKWPNNLKNKT